MPRSKRSELMALRLRAQGIDRRAGIDSVGGAARHLLAIQAQDLGGAKWSIGLRVAGSTDASIEAAIGAGEVVRSWVLRGTLHIVAPEDLEWMLALMRPRLASAAAKQRSDLGITDDQLARASQLAHDSLVGGRTIRRDDLLALFEANAIPTTAQRGYQLLWHLAHAGLLVLGPVDDKQPTFALLSEWVTTSRSLEGDEALGELAGRYFRSHGPATERDFAWWSSQTLGAARVGIALAGVESREIDGVRYYLGESAESAPRGIHALPGFDEYLLGYQDRSGPLPAEFSARIVPGNNGVFMPTVVVDGRIVGTWRRRDTARLARIDVDPFEPLSGRATTGLGSAFARYARFLGKPVDWDGA